MSEATAVKPESRRTEKIGNVVSTKMQKTIVVQVEMRKTHPKYKRVGDVVRIRESRPLSKLKRWTLEEVVRRSSLPQVEEVATPVV
jgi:small subunit ribosomal protein S17